MDRRLQEDLILPHHYTFYELIVNKARGKSGPLFDFGVKDDIRMLGDASMESQDVHAGKVGRGGLRQHLTAASEHQHCCGAAAAVSARDEGSSLQPGRVVYLR
jgi:hypothetical protein